MIKEPGMRLQNFAEDMGIDEFLPQKRCENDKAVVVPNDGLLRPCLSCRSGPAYWRKSILYWKNKKYMIQYSTMPAPEKTPYRETPHK